MAESRARGLLRVGGGLGMAAALWLSVYAWMRMPAHQPLASAERAALLAELRATVDGRRTSGATLAGLRVPAIVTLYDRGVATARVVLGADLAPLRAAAGALAPDVLARARIKVDLVQARAPLATRFWPAVAFGVEPGIDGVGVEGAERGGYLTADDLLAEEMFDAVHFAPTEVRAGLDGKRLLAKLAAAGGVDLAHVRRHAFRFRGDSFVESADLRAALATDRGHTVRKIAPVRAALAAAALLAGQYLLRHEHEGRFDYEYYTLHDQSFAGEYALPRHAGATWFLAQLYGRTGRRELAAGARAALAYLSQQAPAGCDGPELACVGWPGDRNVELGTAAMALVAVSEYVEAVRAHGADGDAQAVAADARALTAWGARLAAFVRSMQKADGDFCHLYDAAAHRRDERTKYLYYSGEGAFALARWAAAAPGDADAHGDDERIARALEALAGEYDRTFAGRFYFGEDHWTCLAGDAAWPRLGATARARIARFCGDYAVFLRRGQFTPDEAITRAHPDWSGAYGFTPLAPPHHTPTGSRTEATLAAWRMARATGGDERDLREQVARGAAFLLRHQITVDDAWLMPDPRAAEGGFHMSDLDRHIRIDFLQHAGSALLRAAEML